MKDKIKVAFINPPHADWSLPQTMTFLSMESHYNAFGKYPDQVEWIEPPYKWNAYTSYDDVYRDVKDADVILFSSYIWNYDLVDELAKHIRQRKSEEKQGVIMLLGGPHIGFDQPDFYENRGMYDFIVQPTTPGELFMIDFLDARINPVMNVEAEFLAFEVRSAKKGNWEFLEESIYDRHFNYLKRIRRYADQHNLEKFVVLETTRGCPFKCVYCEWGGGLGTKIIKKPLNTVKHDIDMLKLAGYSDVYLTDANFGVFKERDREILEYASNMDIKLTDISVVKTKDLEKRKQLVDMFDDLNLDWDLHIPIQSISDQALVDADRIDLSIQDKIELGKYIKKRATENNMITPGVEMIMAMPGSTLDDFYAEFDLLYDFEALTDHRYDYMVFPDSEVSDPEYLAKFNIELVDVFSDNIDEDNIENVSALYSNRQMRFKTISSCYSYTQEEMCEMYFMNFAGPQIIEDHHDAFKNIMSVSELCKFCYDEVLPHMPGFDFIMTEIRDIYNPHTEPKNINVIYYKERTKAITNFVKNNKLLIYGTLAEVMYERA